MLGLELVHDRSVKVEDGDHIGLEAGIPYQDPVTVSVTLNFRQRNGLVLYKF